jgi:hypothetical protein
MRMVHDADEVEVLAARRAVIFGNELGIYEAICPSWNQIL